MSLEPEKLDLLVKRVDLFHGLDRDDVGKIFSKGMTVRALKDEVIFFKGTTGSQMYVVLVGKMGVYNGEDRIAVLAPGEMFGEMALVNREPRSATVKAEADSVLFVLTESTFQNLLSKRVAIQILLNIIRTLSVRLKRKNIESLA
ncbi:MAG: cyclic nucleotide-binding domain-containing protein [Candidatus Hydrogenedentes bacterium]|nr:cyclic nucleotide-binding domain-containing protein [Candidatus Hydrogenedentota bacterium]